MANIKTYTINVRGANLKPSAIKICMDSQKMVANLIAELKELSVSVHPYYHYSSPIVPGSKLVLRIGGEDGFELQEDDVLCDVVKDTRNEQLFTIVELMESEPKRRPGPHWRHPKAMCEDDEDSPATDKYYIHTPGLTVYTNDGITANTLDQDTSDSDTTSDSEVEQDDQSGGVQSTSNPSANNTNTANGVIQVAVGQQLPTMVQDMANDNARYPLICPGLNAKDQEQWRKLRLRLFDTERYRVTARRNPLSVGKQLGEVRNTMRKMEEVAQGTRRSFRVVGSRVAKAERPNQPRL